MIFRPRSPQGLTPRSVAIDNLAHENNSTWSTATTRRARLLDRIPEGLPSQQQVRVVDSKKRDNEDEHTNVG